MLRSGAPRSALRSLNAAGIAKTPFARQNFASQIWTAASRRPQALAAAKPLGLVRCQSIKNPIDNVDIKAEAQKAKEKLTPHPETVSTTSSTHPIMSEVGAGEKHDDTDMMSGIRGDMVR